MEPLKAIRKNEISSLFSSVFILVVLMMSSSESKQVENQCGKMIKAETYLETAADLISRVKDHMPEEGETDCSCPLEPMDCAEVMNCGYNKSGVYKIWPKNRIMMGSVDVYCDLELEGGGWTVLQRRGNYKRPADFFFKNWEKYKFGFGDLRRDFWLGNDNIYALSNQKKYSIRIDLEDFQNNTRYAFYDQFWIDNEKQNYKLHVYDYSGDAGDSFSTFHSGHMFSTFDRDNDNSTDDCAKTYKGAWWYANCYESNLNGLFYKNTQKSKSDGIMWVSWKGNESLKSTEIKIRPVEFGTDVLELGVEIQ